MSYPQGYQPGPAMPYGAPSATERNWAVGSHLSAFAPALISAIAPVPGWSILGPLTMLLFTGDKPFAKQAAKDALNFEITWTIWLVIAFLLIFVLVGLIALPLVAIFMIVGHIIGAVRASRGERYPYPLTIRFFR